jgi:hypothetical protein
MGTGGATALLSPEARAGPGSFGDWHRERPTRISGDDVDLAARSLDFARDDKFFSKNKFGQFSDIYIQVFGKSAVSDRGYNFV